MAFSSRSRKALTLTVALAAATALAACGAGKKNNSTSSGAAGTGTSSSGTASGGKPITIGTTDQVVALDPAGSYDNGSLLLEDNIYQFLMNVPAGAKAPEPDAAQKCSFTTPTEYTCTLKPDQKFSNGDPLTAEDVVFSFNRINKINNPNGPASLHRRHEVASRRPGHRYRRVHAEEPERPDLAVRPRHLGRPDRRQQGLPGRQAARRQQGRRLRPVRDRELQQEPAGRAEGQPELHRRQQGQDRAGHAEVLHPVVEPEARRPERRRSTSRGAA